MFSSERGALVRDRCLPRGVSSTLRTGSSTDRVLDGPASGGEGPKGRNSLDCTRGEGLAAAENARAQGRGS